MGRPANFQKRLLITRIAVIDYYFIFFFDVQRRYVGLERIEGRWDKKGKGSPTSEIESETSRSQGESDANYIKLSFSLFHILCNRERFLFFWVNETVWIYLLEDSPSPYGGEFSRVEQIFFRCTSWRFNSPKACISW